MNVVMYHPLMLSTWALASADAVWQQTRSTIREQIKQETVRKPTKRKEKIVNSLNMFIGCNTFLRWKNGYRVERCDMEASDVCVHKNRSQQTMTYGPNLALYLFTYHYYYW